MTKTFYSISIGWAKTTQHPPLIDGILGLYGDWLRIAPSSWFIWTDQSPKVVAEHISKNLQSEDTVLIFAIDPADGWGSAAEWMWDWFIAKTNGAIPGGRYIDRMLPLRGPSPES